MATDRKTVDLSAYPNLVVIYLGMQALTEKGAITMQNLAPEIEASVAAQPDGLLFHDNVGIVPGPLPGGVFRQYWRDFESLEAWTRTLPHLKWWKDFTSDPGGTSFWHEVYFMRGGMEGIYDNVPTPIGMMGFAPVQPARGPMFSSRQRLGLKGELPIVEGIGEDEVYSGT